MELVLIRHLWGINQPWEDVFPLIREDGYRGVEASLPPPDQRDRFARLLSQHGLEYIPQLFTGGPSVSDHLAAFEKQLREAAELKPRLAVCHSGRDRWPAADALAFYREVADIERAVGLPVAHETHRGRVFYNPWATMAILDQLPQLQLCCDFSHWVVVCERLLDDDSIVQKCAQRCLHLHARVGYEEGPQVPDPAAPEYRRHLEAHERWWDMIWDAQQARGMARSTLTPEFGPPMYLHTLPHTHVPVADLWSVCNGQARRQRERFARRATGVSAAEAPTQDPLR